MAYGGFHLQVAVSRLNDPNEAEEVAWCILRTADYSSLYLAGLDSDLDWEEDVSHGKYEIEI